VGLGRIELATVIGGGLTVAGSSAAPNAVASNAGASTRSSFLVRTTPPVIPALPPAGVAVLAALLGVAARAVQLRTRGVE
jgi:hypothetical protein